MKYSFYLAFLASVASSAFAAGSPYMIKKPILGLGVSQVSSPSNPPNGSGGSPTNQSCTTPWGTTLANGQSALAYNLGQATLYEDCVSETRTCANGVLSGQYQFSQCLPWTPPFTGFQPAPGVSADGWLIDTALYGRYTLKAPIYSGKYYIEYTFPNFRPEIGITTKSTNDVGAVDPAYPLENKVDSAAMYVTTSISNRFAYVSSAAATVALNDGTVASENNGTIGMAIDADNNLVSFYNQNGRIGTLSIKLPKPWFATISRGNSNSYATLAASANTGHAPFTYPVPAGFTPGLAEYPQ